LLKFKDSIIFVAEPDTETISYQRKKQTLRKYKRSTSFCPKCSDLLHVMSKDVRKELAIVPAKVKVIEHVSYVYSCRDCEKNDIETPVITAKAP